MWVLDVDNDAGEQKMKILNLCLAGHQRIQRWWKWKIDAPEFKA